MSALGAEPENICSLSLTAFGPDSDMADLESRSAAAFRHRNVLSLIQNN